MTSSAKSDATVVKPREHCRLLNAVPAATALAGQLVKTGADVSLPVLVEVAFRNHVAQVWLQ